MTAGRPEAKHIATAVVSAARLTGDNPEAAIKGAKDCFRTRLIAFAALGEAFPKASRPALGKLLQLTGPSPSALLNSAKKSDWWRDDWVEEVLGALVADEYGVQAQ